MGSREKAAVVGLITNRIHMLSCSVDARNEFE